MIRRLCFTLFALFPMGLFAQSPWTLKTCIDYGLKNHRSNSVYINERKIAEAQAKEALAAYLPSLNLNGSLDDNLKLQETIIPAGVFGDSDLRVAFSKKINTNLSAQLDQTIYDQSLIVGLKANKYNIKLAELNQEQNQENIIYNISNAYYQILIYSQQLKFLKSNQETYQKQLQISTIQVNQGVTMKKDLDKVTVNLNNSLSQIRVAESNLTLATNQLKYEMGYPIKDSLLVDYSFENHTESVQHITATSTQFFADKRNDYRISAINSKLLEIDQKRIKAGTLPKLTAYARYGGVGFGDHIGPAFSSLSSFSAIGLKLNVPIFDIFKRNAMYNQAKYKYINAEENLILNEGKYQMEFENARVKLIRANSSIEIDLRNMELAQSIFTTTNLQYQKGTTDLIEWLDAQNSLKEAQNNYLNSVYQSLQTQIDLEKAGGTLKTFYSEL